ncbi:Tet(A)/Tet(B)/Tet(C) family tetracycline efflux MFS transporter [Rhizobium sp. SIMBA_035]
MKKALSVVYATVVLDAAGIGLTLPIFPRLLRDVGHTDDLGWRFGAFLALYALMQFLFSPVLGSLSDRFGRKPVLLVSLAGAAIDYVFMALAPALWMLFLGRAIAGLTGASNAVAAACVTDVTEEHERARRFAQLSACFGVGFIAGPAIGGILGEYSVRLPFIAAAVLNGLNFAVAIFLLPETRKRGEGEKGQPLSPFAHFKWLFSFKPLLTLMAAYFLLAFIGEVGGTVWVLYGQDKFAWSAMMVGISLAAFGFFHAVVQAFVAGPVSERWGERRAVLIGVIADSIAYVTIAFLSEGWMVFFLMPLFCLGGIGAPALQSLVTANVDAEAQGRVQGLLASMVSLASIAGSLAISTIYFASRDIFPGLVWVLGAAVYLGLLPLIFSRRPAVPS